MTHYIDIDKIEYRQGVLLDDSMPIIRKVVTIDDIRDWTPTPTVNDVIEGNPEKDEIWAVLVEVLEILKRNLGDD